MMLDTFLFTLSGGMLAAVATAQPSTIAPRFLRLACLIVLAIAVTPAVLWGVGSNAAAGCAVNGLSSIALSVLTVAAFVSVPRNGGRGRLFRWTCTLGGLAGLSFACVSAVALSGPVRSTPLATPVLCIGQVLDGLLLGTITIAWLLGHAYLTATRMTIAPLSHFSRLLWWSVIARAGFTLAGLAVAWLFADNAGLNVIAQLANVWLIASIRVGCGLVVVGVFAYMVADCVRLRSTQSATGILYFASLLAYVGELANQQIIVECGWPL